MELKVPGGAGYALTRPPQTDDELHALVKLLWGVDLPRKQVCPNHVSPFHAFSHAFFSKDPNYGVWYGSRGTGKSLMLAILGLTKAILLDVDVTILGGSMAQSANVHEHNRNLLQFDRAPSWALKKNIATEILTNANAYIRPLPASQKTVRGPHPNTTLLDEVDEMEKKIYDAAMGQAQPEENNPHGATIPEYVVASSTWQNVEGTFTEVLNDAYDNNLPVFTWCWREVIKPHGWMDPEFIERKRRTVPAEFFRVEFDLGEPSGESSAFDINKITPYFIDYEAPVDHRKADGDEEYVWEEPIPGGLYAAGADWAKSKDYTVISVARIDVEPVQLVYWRKVNRRDWPTMIGYFNDVTMRYQASSAHDATGMGNVITDYVDERTLKVVMTSDKRKPLMNEYIVALENGEYRLPNHLFRSHKATTTDAVWGGAQSSDHLADEVVSMAMVHRARTRMPPPVSGIGVAREERSPAWMNGVQRTPAVSTHTMDGIVRFLSFFLPFFFPSFPLSFLSSFFLFVFSFIFSFGYCSLICFYL